MFQFLLKMDNNSAQLLIRVALTTVMFPDGAQKVFGCFAGLGFTRTLQAFSDMGFPVWSSVLLMIT